MGMPRNVIEFADWHAYWVAARMRADETEQYCALISHDGHFDFEVAARGFINAGGLRFSWITAQQEIGMVGGCFSIGEGVMQGWMAATDTAWDTGGHIGITRATRWLHRELFELGVRRIEIACLAKRELTRAWYERSLGFELEGIQRQKGRGGEDVALYAKVRGDRHGIE